MTHEEAMNLTGDEEDPAEIEAAWDRATAEGRVVELIAPPSEALRAAVGELPSLLDAHLAWLADHVATEQDRRAHADQARSSTLADR